MAETSIPAIEGITALDNAELRYIPVSVLGGMILDIQDRAHRAEANHATFKTLTSIEFPLRGLRKQYKTALFHSAVHYFDNEVAYHESATELAAQEGYQINI